MRRRSPLAGTAAALLLLTASAAACSGGETTTDDGTTSSTAAPATSHDGFSGPEDDPGPPVPGGRLTFGLEGEVNSLDPTKGSFAASGHYMASAIYDTLTTIGPDGEVEPYLAESIEPTDELTWAITLRPEVVFHDGTPLDAAAVATNLNAQKASPIGNLFITSFESATATGPLTLEVKTTQPWASFPYSLTTQIGYIASPATISDTTGTATPIGTGPFEYVSWERDSELVVGANPDYWRRDKDGNPLPYLDEIAFYPYPDASERQDRLTAGDLNVVLTYSSDSILDLREGDWKRVEESQGEEDVVAVNTSKPPFDQLIARQALAYATDQEKRVSEAGRGVWSIATSPWVEGQLGYTTDDGWPGYDPAKATELVAQYEAQFGEFTFDYLGVEGTADIGEQNVLVDGWRAAGMDVEVEAVDLPTVITRAVLGDYQATDWRNFGHLDPEGTTCGGTARRSGTVCPPTSRATPPPRSMPRSIWAGQAPTRPFATRPTPKWSAS